jgi:plastocyanin
MISIKSSIIRTYRLGRLFPTLIASGAVASLSSFTARASITTNVMVGDIFFSPKSVTISVGDRVKWTWTGSIQHSTTSNTGLWDSGLRGKGATFTNAFNTAGTFPYHCTLHAGQVGTVTVKAAALTPTTVTISSPGWVSATAFQFAYTATPGLQYIVQRSPDLLSWTPINTNLAASVSISFQDDNAPPQAAFYRVSLLTNP